MSSDDKRLCERSAKGSSQQGVISTSPDGVAVSTLVCHVAGPGWIPVRSLSKKFNFLVK